MCTGHDSKTSNLSKLRTKVSLWQGDITKLKIDVIVNSIHGGEYIGYYDNILKMKDCNTVADCIYKAGGRSLYVEATKSISEGLIPVITQGYDLPAKCNKCTVTCTHTHTHTHKCMHVHMHTHIHTHTCVTHIFINLLSSVVFFVDVVHVEGPYRPHDKNDLSKCYKEALSMLIPKKLRSIVSVIYNIQHSTNKLD